MSGEYIPCSYTATCPERGLGEPLCKEDTHHVYFPASDYKTWVEKTFRNLPDNKMTVCRAVHNAIHRLESPPPKPSRDEMLRAISSVAVNLSAGKRKRLERYA